MIPEIGHILLIITFVVLCVFGISTLTFYRNVNNASMYTCITCAFVWLANTEVSSCQHAWSQTQRSPRVVCVKAPACTCSHIRYADQRQPAGRGPDQTGASFAIASECMHAAQYSSECRDKFDKYCFALIVVVIIQDRKFYTDLHSPLETGICQADFFIMDYPFCLNH